MKQMLSGNSAGYGLKRWGVVLMYGLIIISLTFIFVTSSFAASYDAAPIPDDVKRSVVKRPSTQAQRSLVKSVKLNLNNTVRLLKELEAKEQSSEESAAKEQFFLGKRSHLAAGRTEINTLRMEARRQLSEAGIRLQAKGLGGKVKVKDDILAQFEERFDAIDRALDSVEKSMKKDREKAVKTAKDYLSRLLNKMTDNEPITSEPIETIRQDRPLPKRPQMPASGLPKYITDTPGHKGVFYAFNSDTLLAAAPNIPGNAATECSYDSADLGQSQKEVEQTSEITALAQSLDYSPVKIYKYVSENIRFEPYYGSLKGAQGTLISGGGNATDQASLLIALLRASNVPARYVKGNILIYDATPLDQNGRAPLWLGAKSYAGAANILAQGKNPGVAYYSDAVELTQVWVEACVPYGHYRGAGIDNVGFRWIPMDPSFKIKSYQEGLEHSVSDFDYAGYLTRRTNGTDGLPHELYAKQVEANIRGVDQNSNVADVPYSGVITQPKLDILPASLPYLVTEFLEWGDGNSSAEAKTLPPSHRYQFTIAVSDASNSPLADPVTLNMPEHVLNRITLSFKGATPTDEETLKTWREDGNISSAVQCGINVVPVIKSEGADKIVGTTTSVNLCTDNNRLNLQILLRELDSSTDDCWNTPTPSPACINGVKYANIGAANYHALQAYAFQASDELLNARSEKLAASVRSISNPNTNLEETEGEYLHFVGLKYMRYITDAGKEIGALDGGSGESGNHLGLTSSQMKVEYMFDLPYVVHRPGFLIDVPGQRVRNVDLITGDFQYKTFLLTGYSGSAYEAYIWQENSHLDAVSTVRGIQYANEKGIEVMTLTSANWSVSGDTDCSNPASNCYKFTNNAYDPADPDSNLNYSSTEVNAVKTYYIDHGYTVMIPRSLIKYNDWKGSVYVAEKNDLDNPENPSATATFAINKDHAGGYTTEIIYFSYSPENETGFSIETTNAINGAFIGTEGGVISWGNNETITLDADPVNMVTGNMYHTERDISIRGRGGLPFVFERSYNSRAAKDGPLGYGWTHSFNHHLKFYGVTDGLAKVSWTDGTGNEKFFTTAGHSDGDIISDIALTNPNGTFVTFKRLIDGTYQIREKNGLTYIFESVTGTAAGEQKAKLSSITDRNGNALTMSYTGQNLTQVRDSLNRALTFTYTDNRITQIQDFGSPARTYEYEYDTVGNLISFKNPMSVSSPSMQPPVSYTYYTASDGANLDHAMKTYELPRGNGMTFDYYPDGRVFRHTNTLGEVNTFTYNDISRESTRTNERGHNRKFFFDRYGNVIKHVKEAGGVLEYTYDAIKHHTRRSKTDEAGNRPQYEYDDRGNVTKIINPSGSTVEYSDFNEFSRPGKVKDANNNYTIFKYDARGNLLQSIKLKNGIGEGVDPATYTPVASQIVAWTVNTYDAYGNITSSKRVGNFAAQIADPSSFIGPIVQYSYRDSGGNTQGLRLTSVTKMSDENGNGRIDPAERVTATLEYDSLGRLTKGVNRDLEETWLEYDAVDRVVRATDALGNLRDYFYDENGNPVGQQLMMPVDGVEELVDSSVVSYDQSDRRESITDSGGFVTAYQYDAAGNVVKVTNPDNYSTSLDYDAENRVVETANHANHRVSRELDLSGRPKSMTDPNGNKIRYEYHGSNKDGRIKKVTYPKAGTSGSGRALEYDYDNNGNVTTVTDIPSDGSASRTTTTTYDELNRPTRIVGPQYNDATLGSIRPVTVYTYNSLGYLITVAAGRTNSSGSDVVTTQVTYTYDSFGRRTKETDALGKSWLFEYDRNNNVVKTTDANGNVVRYTWGYGHQLLSKTSDAGTISYKRNPLGQITEVQTPEVTYTYTYDANHRVASATDNRLNKTLSYEYSAGGKLVRITDSDGKLTDYTYDAAGRLSGIIAPNDDLVSFIYDAGGRLTEKWFPNGASSSYAYNADNTLRQVKNLRSSSEIISQHDYTYDGVGNRKTHTELIDGTTTPYRYTYDELNRLKEVKNDSTDALIEGYTYDPLNNRTSKTDGVNLVYYKYNAANQLEEVRQGSIEGTVLASMLYDDNGNMTTKTEGETTTNMVYDALNRLTQVNKTDMAIQNYSYDDQGRRISKTVGEAITNYLYNGPDIYGEYANLTATATYTHGPNMDEPIMRISGTSTQYYHQDGLGSVVGMSNKADATIVNQRFDAWGNIVESTGSIPQYGYTGREPDETGLVYYRARYYDPALGIFTQRDPIGLMGGLNQYAYVNGNPVNFVDPLGLQKTGPTNTVESVYPSALSTASELQGMVQLADNSFGNVASDAGGILPAKQEKIDVANLVFNEAINNYIGDKDYAGLCNEYVMDVYEDAGYPLTGYKRARDFQNFSELTVTKDPVPGDIAQFLQSKGAPYDHVAIYAGDNNIITTTRSTNPKTQGAITQMSIKQFRSGQPYQYLHYKEK